MDRFQRTSPAQRDCEGNRVVVFNKDFRWLFSMGSPGEGPGRFTNICSVAVDPSGVFIIADVTGMISFFLPNGTYAGRIGEWGSETGQFGVMGRLLVMASGTVLIPEPDNGRIQEIVVETKSLHPIKIPEFGVLVFPVLLVGSIYALMSRRRRRWTA